MDSPKIDKDGSIRFDWWIRRAIWEDGEYVITAGGEPVSQTMSLHDARVLERYLPAILSQIWPRPA